MLRKFLGMWVLLHLLIPHYSTAGTMSVFGIGSLTKQRDNYPDVEPPAVRTLDYGYGYSGGLLYSFFVKRFRLETGFMVVQRRVHETLVAPGIIRAGALVCQGPDDDSCKAENTVVTLHFEVPLLWRIYLGKKLSIGVGGYFARYFGTVDEELVVTPKLGTVLKYTAARYPSSVNRKIYDWGGAVSIAYDWGVFKPKTGLTLFTEARYDYDMTNSRVDGSFVTKYDSFLAFIGVRFTLGKKGSSGAVGGGKTHTW